MFEKSSIGKIKFWMKVCLVAIGRMYGNRSDYILKIGKDTTARGLAIHVQNSQGIKVTATSRIRVSILDDE